MLSKKIISEAKNKSLKNEYFKPLSEYISTYELDLWKSQTSKTNKTDYNKNLTILCNKSCYRTFGIIGLRYLIDKLNKLPTYKFVSLQTAYSYNFSKEDYDSYMWDDILIISGNYKGFKEETYPFVDEIIAEIISVRMDANKLTWLFLDGITINELNKNLKNTLLKAPFEKSVVI